jgi:alpha-amylase
MSVAFERILAEQAQSPNGDPRAPFLRGGFWDGFLAKYPEANALHKRMLLASERVELAAQRASRSRARGAAAAVERARDRLYRSQVNCPYWHGIFGGLYLNYLRANAYSNMIAAETAAEPIVRRRRSWLETSERDLDLDGLAEVVVSTPHAFVAISPGRGGALVEWDHRDPAVNLTDVLARRREAYHERILAQAAAHAGAGGADAAAAGSPQSIHDLAADVSPELLAHLVEDGAPRHSLRDRVLPETATLASVEAAPLEDRARFFERAYAARAAQRGAAPEPGAVTLEAESQLDEAGTRIALEKRVRVAGSRDEIEVAYTIRHAGGAPARLRFAPELNLTLHAGDAPDRYLRLGGARPADPRLASRGVARGVQAFEMIDEWRGLVVKATFTCPVELWRYPVMTVSRSESGFELVYQGTCFLPIFDVLLEERAEASLGLTLSARKTKVGQRTARRRSG